MQMLLKEIQSRKLKLH